MYCLYCGVNCYPHVFCTNLTCVAYMKPREEFTMNEREKNFPRVTPDDIEFAIEHAKQVYYGIIPNTTTTICAVTLGNGFTVIGKSAAVSKENFDQKIGEQVALDDVRDQLWELLGFRLKQALWEGEGP